jgi:EAL domain-containing protein (putative c-di-GMP-specific phosphodiesterase class I)/GGDEF domain-containing protein
MTSVLEGLPDLVMLVRRDGVLLAHGGGRGVADLLPVDASIGQKIDSIWPAAASGAVRHLVRQALASRKTHDATFREGERTYEARVCAQGPNRAICLIRQPAVNAADEHTGTTGRFGAVAPQFDRRSFLRRFHESLSIATLREQPTAVAVIHVDGVVDVSRVIDSHVAEQAMNAAIARLTAEEDSSEIGWYVGQLSESQIVIVIESRDRDRIEALIEGHCDSLREPIKVGDAEFHLTPYAGVAILGPDASAPRRLLNHARGTAAEARRAGSSRVCFFSDTVRLRSLARLDLAQELREAIADRSITLRYMARRDLVSGELLAAVGYVRWHHPLRGEVSPSEFLAVAEATGLATALSRAALQRLRDDHADLARVGGPNLALSFGPLRHHILGDGFLDDIRNLLSDGQLRPDRLELRISERALFAADMSLLQAIVRLGVRLIVDEVGRGIGAFDLLARAPLAGLQIDRASVHSLAHDPSAVKICRGGFAVAQAMGLTSMARGVDSAEQRDVLAGLGCSQGIGDLYGEMNLAYGAQPRAAAG